MSTGSKKLCAKSSTAWEELKAMSDEKEKKERKIDLSRSDGIQISDKPTWEHTAKELWVILGKRCISLPSKLLGFKPFCLYAATWLLVKGHIRDWIWFCIVVIVLFGIVGLKLLTQWKPGNKE
jgi:hypothetical protein